MHASRSHALAAIPAIALGSSLALSACTGAAPGEFGSIRTEIDSIGDTLVVRTLGSSLNGLITLVEDARIGELEGEDEYMFGQISEVIALPNGHVLAFDQQAVALREYGGDGRVVRTIGRRGAGPGEYQAANGVTVLPDGRIAIWDPRNGRIQFFGADGSADSQSLVPSGFYTSRSLWNDGGGRLIYRVNLPPGPEDRETFAGARPGVARLSIADGSTDSLPAPVRIDRAIFLTATTPDGSGSSSSTVPFYGGPVWTVYGGGFAYTRDGEYRIIIERADGPMVIEREVEPVAVLPAERDSYRVQSTANMRRMNQGWTWNGPPIPDYKRPIRSLRSDADGRLWVSVAMPGVVDSSRMVESEALGPDEIPPQIWTEPAALDVFGADGRFIGRVVLPERVSGYMMSSAGDHLWAVQTDEMGVNQLVRWRIVGADE